MKNNAYSYISRQKFMSVKNGVWILLAISAMMLFTSCEKVEGEGPVVTETRGVTGFKSVAVSISGRVEYKIDSVYKVEVQAQQNILNILQTNKAGDELVIKFQDGKRVRNNEEIIVTISAPYAEGINMSGSALFNLIGKVSATNMRIRLSGSGNINIPEINVSDNLTATISGSGNITISNGTAKNENLEISGSGYINAEHVWTEKATAKVSGSGSMQISVSQRLDATISGSGSILYHGNPVVNSHVSGSGAVVHF